MRQIYKRREKTYKRVGCAGERKGGVYFAYTELRVELKD
jgi:hypothetical protein